MRKGETLNGYKIITDFKLAGGQSKVAFAIKGGKEFFVKEFLSPKYPVPLSPGSDKIKKRKRKQCETFLKHHKKIISLLRLKTSLNGNLVVPVDFFRVGSTFYKINEKVKICSTIDDIHKKDLPVIVSLLETLCQSLSILHSIDLIHGDLKPDNILFENSKSKSGKIIPKLIDFDNGFFQKKPPENREDIVGDQVYYSPELGAYINSHSSITSDSLTTKSDIFALGLIFHQALVGKLPKCTRDYAWQQALDGEIIRLSKSEIDEEIVPLISSMLHSNYKERPDTDSIIRSLRAIHSGETVEISAESKIDGRKSKLRGTLFKGKSDETSSSDKVSKSRLKGSLFKKKD